MKASNAAAILLQSVMCAVCYGIVHDEIAARICPEYFTLAHPDLGWPALYHASSPTVLGLAWGATATWSVGFLIGWPLALIATLGEAPVLRPQALWRPIGWLLAGTACGAVLAGLCGWAVGTHRPVLFDGDLGTLPRSMQIGLYIDLWAHSASYLGGGIGGLVLWWHAARMRQSRR